MYKFNYVTKSSDGKMTGQVNADFISHSVLGRSMTGVVTADSGKFIRFTLSDGSQIKFVLNDDSAEVQYTASRRN